MACGAPGIGEAEAEDDVIEARFQQLEQRFTGDATLADQNGRISARDITGSVDAHTSFANLEIESAGHVFKCRNQNGTIRLRASSPEVAIIDAQTSFAGIEVFLPAGLKPAIQARTTFAEVESDFPVMMKSEGQNALAEADPASPRITLKNQNGPIRIVGEKSMHRHAHRGRPPLRGQKTHGFDHRLPNLHLHPALGDWINLFQRLLQQ